MRRVVGAALLGSALLATAADACPPRRGGFKIFQALLYADMPDLSEQGVAPIHVVDRGFWKGADQSGVADPVKVASVLAKLPRDGAPIVIDIEWPGLLYKHSDRSASTRALAQIRQLAQIAAAFKAAAGTRAVGYYGVFPLDDYWRAIDVPPGSFREWQGDNEDAAQINAHVDVTFPSLYTYYRDRAGWVRQANALVCEARRISGKPVYAFVWPEFFSAKGSGGGYLPADYWQLELETLYGIADGVVLWGGYDAPTNGLQKWDNEAPWWKVTKELLVKWRLKRPCSRSRVGHVARSTAPLTLASKRHAETRVDAVNLTSIIHLPN